jgi:CRISPR/Cas system CSM-associated protein Csm2 small subunit
MKKIIQLATLSTLLAFSQPALEHELSAQPMSQSPRVISQQISGNELLKGELKAIREYHDSLLDTVYWTLGIVFGLVLVIIGSSWYTNFRLYEADKARLLEEVERKIAEANSRSARDLQGLSSNISDKADRDLLKLDNRLSTELERLRSDIKDSNIRINSDFKKLEEAFEIFLKFPELIRGQLNRISLDTQLNTERIWELKGSPVKVLLSQFLAFDAAIRTGDNEAIKAVLERMKDNLSQSVLPSGKKISPDLLDILRKSLSQAKENGPSGDHSVSLDLSLLSEILELLDETSTTESV